MISAEGTLGRSVAIAVGVARTAGLAAFPSALGAPEAELELGEPHAATTDPNARITSSTRISQPSRMPYLPFMTSPFGCASSGQMVWLDGGRRGFFADDRSEVTTEGAVVRIRLRHPVVSRETASSTLRQILVV